ncbi:MAG: hypothetical protein MI919_00885 [Holophagales bacterium]|nr:hypothetical protein [Holophagales bacterium]
MSWTVDEALEEVANAIEAGAAPLSIDPETRKTLQALFVEDFENQRAVGARWFQDKERVLPLARRIGRRAKLLTLDRLALSAHADDDVERVDPEVARRAAYFVCKTYQIAGRKAGPYCPGIKAPPSMQSHESLDRLLVKIRQSGFEV